MRTNNTAIAPLAGFSYGHWPRLAALALAVVAIGLPVNHLSGYALLLIAAVLIFSGRLSLRPGRWLAAAAAVAVAALLPLIIAPAPIAQGSNVFLPNKRGNVFERQMPPEVYRIMKAEFEALYPPSVRCKPNSMGCWQDQGQPDRLYAFSADGVFGNPAYSRSVTGIDFSDPLWLRLGFVNDARYNWYTAAPDLHRADRNRQFWMGLWRWRTTMPWFVMHQFPADYAGSFCAGGATCCGRAPTAITNRSATQAWPAACLRPPTSAGRFSRRPSSRARWRWCCIRRRASKRG